MGRCGECGEFGTFVEEVERPSSAGGTNRSRPTVEAIALPEAGSIEAARTPTGVPELDLVLGGGLVAGSVVLLGGEPGIGKSTLLLQVADALARSGVGVLYVCGEESPQQVGMRAQRIGASSERVTLLPELDVAVVEDAIRAGSFGALILDSIQTAFDPDLEGAPGSVGQVRACTARLTRIAKGLGIPILIVGHVTKDGAIAGPRVLEHMVDAVLYFEGDRDHAFRIVRAVKNRFGSVSEVGIFEMTGSGLVGVESPSAALLAERAEAVAGSAVMAAVEGSRPLLVEVQALVTPSFLPAPRRLATGIDASRLLQVLAVLERRGGVSFAGQDVLASIAGGFRVSEPAVDLPLALALVSALRDRALPADVALFGEIGLTGHVRAVSHASARTREAERFGLTHVVGGASASADSGSFERVANVEEAIALLL